MPACQRDGDRVDGCDACDEHTRLVHATSVRQTEECHPDDGRTNGMRSEEHTSELQSRRNLVCRLLLEKKKMFMCMNLNVLVFGCMCGCMCIYK